MAWGMAHEVARARRWTAAFLALVACFGVAMFRAELVRAEPPRAPLRLFGDEWPPFTDAEGKPREAIDLVESALLRSGVRSQYTIMNWHEAEQLLEKGHLDGAAAMWKSPEREKYLLFSKPYLENRLILVGRKGENVSQKVVSELSGKRLALTRGYAYGKGVTQATDVQYTFYANDAECLRAVLNNQADYLLLDELMVEHLFRAYSDKAQRLIVAGPEAMAIHPLHLALRRDYPGASQIIADFNRNVAHMMTDGSYNVLLHVPWIRKDVNGDGSVDYVASSKITSRGDNDPSMTHGAYSLFNPPTRPAGTGQPAPAYVIDGKSYNTWGDAATTLDRAGPNPPTGTYKYSTGFVLGSF
jgi:ABC-type amino acid transport substrate-binding protein